MWVRSLARRVISAFAPEADLYRRSGVDTVWVGHPLVDVVGVREDTAPVLTAIGLDPSRPLVAVMPGSRRRELKALLAPMLAAARLLQARRPALQFALPLASEAFRAEVEQAVLDSGVRDIAIYRPRSYAVLSRAQAALQCSGTATLEAALLGIPSVIVYRLHAIEYVAARHVLMHVPFIGMPNLLLGEMVQPELFHRHVTAERMADEMWALLSDTARNEAIRSRLACIRERLGPPGVFPRAAQAVVDLLPLSANDLGLAAAS
jgi:lipid-A-disaccharide synthase